MRQQQFIAEAHEFRGKFLCCLATYPKDGPHLVQSLTQNEDIATTVALFARMYVRPQRSKFLREWRASAAELTTLANVAEALGNQRAIQFHDAATRRRSRRFSKGDWWAVVAVEVLLSLYILRATPTAAQLKAVVDAASEAAGLRPDPDNFETFRRGLSDFRKSNPAFIEELARALHTPGI